MGESNFVEFLYRQISMIWTASRLTSRKHSHKAEQHLSVHIYKAKTRASLLHSRKQLNRSQRFHITAYRVTTRRCSMCVYVGGCGCGCMGVWVHLFGDGVGGKKLRIQHFWNIAWLFKKKKKKVALRYHLYTNVHPVNSVPDFIPIIIPKGLHIRLCNKIFYYSKPY